MAVSSFRKEGRSSCIVVCDAGAKARTLQSCLRPGRSACNRVELSTPTRSCHGPGLPEPPRRLTQVLHVVGFVSTAAALPPPAQQSWIPS